MGVENRTSVLCKSSQCYSPLNLPYYVIGAGLELALCIYLVGVFLGVHMHAEVCAYVCKEGESEYSSSVTLYLIF